MASRAASTSINSWELPVPFPNHQSDLDADTSSQPQAENPQMVELGPLVDALLRDLPEFAPTYRELVEAGDDDPGDPVVLIELADFVEARLAVLATGRSILERAFGVIESLIDSLADDEIGCELVGMAFFDSFSPESRRLLAPWLGPRSLGVLEALEVSDAGFE
jgi:hypothetical protein